MEEKHFINRDNEKAAILKALDNKGPELIIIYGRRRIGKSRFLREIAKIKSIKLITMLEDTDYQINLVKVARIIEENLNLPSFKPQNFRELFEALPSRSVLVLDEYSYIASATAEFQAIWEEVVKPKAIKLILSGSMIRVMEDLNYSLSSPLYGRATQIIKMLPLQINHVKQWYGARAKFEDCLQTYFAIGGVPRYLEIITKPGLSGIKSSFFSKDSLFLREGKLLLKESFPKSDVIPKIFYTVASGETEASKIASKSGVKASEVSKYLSLLIDYGFVEKKFPLMTGGKKDVQFYPADAFMAFWMRFIWPHYSEIDLGFTARAEEFFDKDFNGYSGLKFEKAVLNMIYLYPQLIPHHFTRIGNQWGRVPNTKGQTYEIDLLALDSAGKQISCIECKWQNKVNALTVASQLNAKLNFCDWVGNYEKFYIIIFAKSFSKKIDVHEGKTVLCYALQDLVRTLSTSKN